MDQLRAMTWYEARCVPSRPCSQSARATVSTLQVAAALKVAGGPFINHFGRAATEELARWHGPQPDVPSLMKH